MLAEAPEAVEFVDWWLLSLVWNPANGSPIGVRRWPFRGGLMRQPRPIVEAAKLLLAEYLRMRQEQKGTAT